jgi:very-short-patch-repair endonuclease
MGDKVDAALAARAAEQWGVVSTDDLRECGLSRKALEVRLRAGRLHPIHRGVYAVGHASLPLEGRFLAATKACGPRAVLSHFSAAVLWGLFTWEERFIEVTAPTGHRHPGLRTRRTSDLPLDAAVVHRGIPTTTPARTLKDLAATLPDQGLKRAVRQAQTLHLVHSSQITDGPRRLRNILATGPAPTRSVLEDVVLDLILKGGLQHPQVNAPLRIGMRTVIPDFRWPTQRLVVEADGAAFHAYTSDDDAQRQALLEADGERVLRVTWAQAVGRPTQTLARLRAAGAPETEPWP